MYNSVFLAVNPKLTFSVPVLCINGSSSCWERVISGVPQGSVIGPILFLIYINDLDLDVDNDLLKFADDTKLYGVVTNGDEALSMQKDLNVLTQWTSGPSRATAGPGKTSRGPVTSPRFCVH